MSPPGTEFINTTKQNTTNRVHIWWRHQMETFSALLTFCAGNSPVTGEFPAHRPVTRSFDVFFDLRLYKRLSKQSWGRWFETPSRPLWRHCTVFYGISLHHCVKCRKFVMLTTFWLLAAPEVVTWHRRLSHDNPGTANDKNIVNMTTFPFHWVAGYLADIGSGWELIRLGPRTTTVNFWWLVLIQLRKVAKLFEKKTNFQHFNSSI